MAPRVVHGRSVRTEEQKAVARDYYRRNRERIRSQQQQHRLSQSGKEVNNRSSSEWYARAKARGVVIHRLKPPRSLSQAAARQRWRVTLRSTNGDWSGGDSVWDYVMRYDIRRIRYRERSIR